MKINFLQKNKLKNIKGITLIELLLYISLVAVIILTISSFFVLIQKDNVKNQVIASVNDEGKFVVDIINRAIRNSESITSPAVGASGDSLVLKMSDLNKDPTVFSIDENGVLNMTEGISNPVSITDNKIFFNKTGNNYAYESTFGVNGTDNGQFSSPFGIALDSNNNIYVVDSGNGRIQKFDSSGNYITQWGTWGSENGQFNWPYSIAIDKANNVYVGDQSNGRIQKFDSSGNYITQWGTWGSENGQFSDLRFIAVDSSNNIYVADSGNNRIQKFDSSGNYITQWGTPGNENGQFGNPQGLTIDSSNNVYVIDNTNRIQKFDSLGNYILQWNDSALNNDQISSHFQGPEGLSVDLFNNIYLADKGNSRIIKFDSLGNYLTQFGTQGSDDGQLNNPEDLVVDSTGNVYIADANNNRIQKFVLNIFYVTPTGGDKNVLFNFNLKSNTTNPGFEYNYNKDFSSGSTLRPNANYSSSGVYSLTYTPGVNGSILGALQQSVNSGFNGTAVTAVPDTDYHFLKWSDNSTQNPRTDINVTQDISVIANFVSDHLNLIYVTGANGSVTGDTNQSIYFGDNGTAVTAVPDLGYRFVSWSDGTNQNPRTDINVQDNISVTANFSALQYTLNYTSGAHGYISGTSPQTVNYGADGTTMTARPNNGYYFLNWSDGSTSNPRIDTSVISNISVTANFSNQYYLTYTPGTNGTITGNTSQTVNYHNNGTAVTTVPNSGYHFVNWSDGSNSNPRTDYVTRDITVTANFAINQYTLFYSAGAHGSISGTSPQTVNYGADGAPINAVPNAGYHFVSWSDDSTSNPRTDTNVIGNISVTANFTNDWVDVGTAGFSASSGSSNSGISFVLDSFNVPYVVYADNTNSSKATVMKFNGSSWENVGTPGISDEGVGVLSLHLDSNNNLYLAYIDFANNYNVTVMKFNGSSWENVGTPGFTMSPNGMGSFGFALSPSNIPYVVYLDGSKATVKKFNGSSWENVGVAKFSPGGINYPSIAIDSLGVPYVAFEDFYNNQKITVMKYNGSIWETVGNAGFSLGQTSNYFSRLALDSNNVPYVAYTNDVNGSKTTVMKFNGSSWENVGTAEFSAGLVGSSISLVLDSNNIPYLAYNDSANNFRAVVMKFNGSSWENVGTSGFSPSVADFISLVLDSNNTPYVAYIDLANSNKITVKKYMPSI